MHNKILLSALLIIALPVFTMARQPLDSLLPVRAFCIAAPTPQKLNEFVRFINEELAPRQVNTLILRVDFDYAFTSRPELRSSNPLSNADVKKLVAASRAKGIRIIPQINLLGHQSWAGTTGKLLQVYPQLDETPHVKMPATYKWPNDDGLYCKSYCPLHPDVHSIVLPLVDEICDAFETDAFHAGMDEVFYIGDDKCPRCKGKNKAALFAGEVKVIRDHLAAKKRELWIWGDRLIDGKTTGIGMWEASENDTYAAIDLIPKDVVICDWHYERADKTAVYFAMKGFRVLTCPWRKPDLAVQQLQDMVNFRTHATKAMKGRFLGMMQTVWSDAGSFMTGMQQNKKDQQGGTQTPWHCFKSLYDAINRLSTPVAVQ